MTVFVDTSALYAFMDQDDDDYESVVLAWRKLQTDGAEVVISNYVVVETASLCQRRLGTSITRRFLEGVVSALEVHWVDEAVHGAAVQRLLDGNRRDLSLVDCTSFILMRRLGITRAFALDQHFRDRGFDCVP